jgi:hypothetical protein
LSFVPIPYPLFPISCPYHRPPFSKNQVRGEAAMNPRTRNRPSPEQQQYIGFFKAEEKEIAGGRLSVLRRRFFVFLITGISPVSL